MEWSCPMCQRVYANGCPEVDGGRRCSCGHWSVMATDMRPIPRAESPIELRCAECGERIAPDDGQAFHGGKAYHWPACVR